MRFVPSLLGVVLALVGIPSFAVSSPATAKPMDACHLLTNAQASSLLRGTVKAQNVGTSIPLCTYWLSSPSSPGGQTPGMMLALRKGSGARTTYYELLHGKAHLPNGFHLAAKELTPHRITVDGVHAYYMIESPPAHGTSPTFGSTFVALEHGNMVIIGIKALADYVSVGRKALGDVLARLH